MYTTEAARELYKLQGFYRQLALCEDPAIAEEANHKANEIQGLIMKLVDIESDIRDMRSDYEKTCEDVIITTYEVVDNNQETMQCFPSLPLAKAYFRKHQLLGETDMEIQEKCLFACVAHYWDLNIIWKMTDEIDAYSKPLRKEG